MEIEKFLNLFQKSLEIKGKNISLDTNIQDLDEWDSMTLLMLIALVSKEFGVILDAESILELTTIQSLVEKIGIDKFNLDK